MADRLIVDCGTGEAVVRAMTAEEQAAFDAGRADVAAADQERRSLRAALDAVLPTEQESATDAQELASVIDAIRTYLAAGGNQRTDAQRMAFERNVGRVLRHLVRRLA